MYFINAYYFLFTGIDETQVLREINKGIFKGKGEIGLYKIDLRRNLGTSLDPILTITLGISLDIYSVSIWTVYSFFRGVQQNFSS